MSDPDSSALQSLLSNNGLGHLYKVLAEKDVTSLTDLVIFLAYQESLQALELPLVAVCELKHVMELCIEFFNQGGQVKPEQEAFFFQYTTIATLQRDSWARIQLSFNHQFEYEEKRIIQTIWSSNSTLRQSLMESYLPADLADALESEGVRAICEIPTAHLSKFAEGLTTNEQANLKRIHRSANESSSRKWKQREDAERKLLREKIDKANAIVRQVGEPGDPAEKMLKMAELIKVLELDTSSQDLLSSMDDTLKSVRRSLDHSSRYLLSTPSSHSSDEDLIRSVSLGSTLRGLVVGLDAAENLISQAPSQILSSPDVSPVITPRFETAEMQSFIFSSHQSATSFQKMVNSTGASFGFKMFELAAENQEENNNNDVTAILSDCFVRLICHRFPTASFQLDKSEVVFTAAALEQLQAISDLESAEEFILRYGSHISTGRFQLGGILWQKLYISTEKPVTWRELEELASKWLNEGGPVSDRGSITIPLSTTTSAKLCFESEALGPSIFNPLLFKQVLLSSSDTWHVIDRGGFDSLLPVWEVVLGLHPHLNQQCELLRKTWLANTLHITDPFVVQQRANCALQKDEMSSLYLTIANESSTEILTPDGGPQPRHCYCRTRRSNVNFQNNRRRSVQTLKKSYVDILVDRSFNSIKQQEEATVYLMNCLRFRMNIASLNGSGSIRSLRAVQSAIASPSRISLYDTLLRLLAEFDASGRAEIFRLLLERRSAIPLFLPGGEHHLPILRLVNKVVCNNRTVCLGEDIQLLRLSVISCRKKENSKTTELLKEAFHLDSLHREDFAMDCFTREATTAEIGLGCILLPQSERKEPVHLLVLNVVGDFDPLWNFIKGFSDYLIIEDATNNEDEKFYRRTQFSTYKGASKCPGLEGIDSVLVWKSSADALVAEWFEGNGNDFGFEHLQIHSSLGKAFYNQIISDLLDPEAAHSKTVKTKQMLHEMSQLLPGKYEAIDCLLPFNIKASIKQVTGDFSSLRAVEFKLQKSFYDQAKHEEEQAQHRNNESVKIETDRLIQQQVALRKELALKVEKHPLLDLFVKQLQLQDGSSRVLSFRELEKSLSHLSEATMGPLRTEISELSSHFAELSQSKSREKELEPVRRQLQQAKERYNSTVVSTEHLWRELSHYYTAHPSKYRMYPKLAAKHLMDGLPLELVDGDSNMINLDWIKATLCSLEELLSLNNKSKRIFVLSMMGVQSSGKSTLLNLMFGVQMKTSVGQCTRGVNMQLIPVQGRDEYDYILLLDTEGTRAPEFWGMPGSEKRDNQMATLSILLADATIIVNPGENDSAIKEILPIVLLAYQGSKLAEEKGGRPSSMVFFVYNRIDTQQKDKLGNILQVLGTSLHDAFAKVSQLLGTSDDCREMSLFRWFKLDASNLSESDVRILGNIKKSFVPPDDIPDPAYGKALTEFREHIHSRVTRQEWKSRSFSDIFEYIQLVWLCIRSADFTLNFKTVVERQAFDQLNVEYKKHEKELMDVYYNSSAQIEKEILAKKWQSERDATEFKEFEMKLLNLVGGKEVEFNGRVATAIEQDGRVKWRREFELQWTKFKCVEKQRWIDRLRIFFHCQLKYDLHLSKYKKEMKHHIRQLFAANNQDAMQWSEERKRQEFDLMFNLFLAKAKADFPAVVVRDRVEEVYINNKRMMGLQIDLHHPETVAEVDKDIVVLTCSSQPDESAFLRVLSTIIANKTPTDRLQKIKEEISTRIANCTEPEQVFMSPTVDRVIDIAIQVTNINNCPNKETQYVHILAKSLLTIFLAKKQRLWERVNSVSAKLDQPSTREEMRDYFYSVSHGIVSTELLVKTIGFNLKNILPKGFEKELIQSVDLRVRTKTWFSDPKVLQARLDLALIHLIDEGKIGEMLDKIRKSATFYQDVLVDLITLEIPDVKEECESFYTQFQTGVHSAVGAALSVETGRAEKLIEELHSQCLKVFRDNYLAMHLVTDADGYDDCDNEDGDVFKVKCLQLIQHCALNCCWPTHWKSNWKKELSKQVLLHMRNVRREEVARPRCRAFCPLCRSLCIHPANHDTATVKHDTFHQPQGLTGGRWSSEVRREELRGTLCHQTCSVDFLENNNFKFNGKWTKYKDFCRVYPDWVDPKLTERLPLREFIFANYQEDLARKYARKQCVDIPSHYRHHLETIRADLERTANQSTALNQD